jgi:hypothetical protein
MICWPGRLDRGEALDGTMPKSKKGSHGEGYKDVILSAAVHQTQMTKFMIRKALRDATLEESLGDNRPFLKPTPRKCRQAPRTLWSFSGSLWSAWQV